MNNVINVTHLSKDFKNIKAVDDLSFSVLKGQVYGFLGQNGAGKSTTIRMLLTLIMPTHGAISVFGKDIRQYRNEILSQVGAIIEKPDQYKYLTAYENLQIVAKWNKVNPGKKELMTQLEKVGLADRAHSKVKTFSQGMKQRLGIACALINDPGLIILDEPTNGLDPQGIADVRNLILQLSKEEGKTILVSSHLLSEIELIADSMLIIDKGKKVAEGSVSDLLNPADTLLELQTTDNNLTVSVLEQSQWHDKFEREESRILLRIHRNIIPGLVSFLVQNNVQITSVQPRHSLEDYFLKLTTSNRHVGTYQN